LRIILLVLAAGLAGGVWLAFGPHSAGDLRELVGSVGIAAPIVLLALWLMLVPLLVSGTLLAAATGLILGPIAGVAVSVAGATLGAGLAFLFARAGAGTPHAGSLGSA
jgi:uncharacterized membrane protein YdjX (TVP38/TMEM64 family)